MRYLDWVVQPVAHDGDGSAEVLVLVLVRVQDWADFLFDRRFEERSRVHQRRNQVR